MPNSYCCHCLPCSHFTVSCCRGRGAGCVGWWSEEGWGMRCQVRELGCLCQVALTHAADRAHQLAAGSQTSKPNCSRKDREKEQGVQRWAYAGCQLAPSRQPPALWYWQCWKLQQRECPVCCQVKRKSPSLSPGVNPQAFPSLSPRREYSPRPAVFQQYLILKKWDRHFWFPSKATVHPGTFQSMTTHTHTQKR